MSQLVQRGVRAAALLVAGVIALSVAVPAQAATPASSGGATVAVSVGPSAASGPIPAVPPARAAAAPRDWTW